VFIKKRLTGRFALPKDATQKVFIKKRLTGTFALRYFTPDRLERSLESRRFSAVAGANLTPQRITPWIEFSSSRSFAALDIRSASDIN
jgi:hypothetical protein